MLGAYVVGLMYGFFAVSATLLILALIAVTIIISTNKLIFRIKVLGFGRRKVVVFNSVVCDEVDQQDDYEMGKLIC